MLARSSHLQLHTNRIQDDASSTVDMKLGGSEITQVTTLASLLLFACLPGCSLRRKILHVQHLDKHFLRGQVGCRIRSLKRGVGLSPRDLCVSVTSA